MSRYVRVVSPLALVLLAACGGGGSEGGGIVPPPPQAVDPQGLWRGSADSGRDRLRATLLASGEGAAYALLDDAQGAAIEAVYLSDLGPEAFVPGHVGSTGQGYYRHVAGGFYQSLNMATLSDASGRTRHRLQLQVGQGLPANWTRQLGVDYDPAYERSWSLEQLQGRYISRQSGHAMPQLRLSLADPDRMLSSDNAGCSFSNSRLRASGKERNFFYVIGLLRGPACGFEGAATGLGFVTSDALGQPNGLTLMLRQSSGQGFFAFQGQRV